MRFHLDADADDGEGEGASIEAPERRSLRNAHASSASAAT